MARLGPQRQKENNGQMAIVCILSHEIQPFFYQLIILVLLQNPLSVLRHKTSLLQLMFV